MKTIVYVLKFHITAKKAKLINRIMNKIIAFCRHAGLAQSLVSPSLVWSAETRVCLQRAETSFPGSEKFKTKALAGSTSGENLSLPGSAFSQRRKD